MLHSGLSPLQISDGDPADPTREGGTITQLITMILIDYSMVNIIMVMITDGNMSDSYLCPCNTSCIGIVSQVIVSTE